MCLYKYSKNKLCISTPDMCTSPHLCRGRPAWSPECCHSRSGQPKLRKNLSKHTTSSTFPLVNPTFTLVLESMGFLSKASMFEFFFQMITKPGSRRSTFKVIARKRADTCTKEEMCDGCVAREEILPSGIPLLGDSLEGFYFFQCYTTCVWKRPVQNFR